MKGRTKSQSCTVVFDLCRQRDNLVTRTVVKHDMTPEVALIYGEQLLKRYKTPYSCSVRYEQKYNWWLTQE